MTSADPKQRPGTAVALLPPKAPCPGAPVGGCETPFRAVGEDAIDEAIAAEDGVVAGALLSAGQASDAPLGAEARLVRAWFDQAVEIAEPVMDGTLAAEQDAAATYRRMAKAANTRNAYRAAVRAWCAWCARRDRPALPAYGVDVATFLAAERRRGLAPNTIDLRRAAIRYLHRAAGCPVPTDDACVAETLAGIRRDAAARGVLPDKKVAATATIVRQLLAAIPDDPTGGLPGLRDRALILVGFAGALRRSELIASGSSTSRRPSASCG